MSAEGCRYITGTALKGTKTVNLFCNKLRDEGSDFCPKHALFVADEALEPERKKSRASLRRKWRRERAEALAASPLAAHNPAFDEKRKTNLMEPVK